MFSASRIIRKGVANWQLETGPAALPLTKADRYLSLLLEKTTFLLPNNSKYPTLNATIRSGPLDAASSGLRVTIEA